MLSGRQSILVAIAVVVALFVGVNFIPALPTSVAIALLVLLGVLLLGSAIDALFVCGATNLVAKFKPSQWKVFGVVLVVNTAYVAVLVLATIVTQDRGLGTIVGLLAWIAVGIYGYSQFIEYPYSFEDPRIGSVGYRVGAAIWAVALGLRLAAAFCILVVVILVIQNKG